jgi:serine/threonine protein kinase
MEDLIGKQLGSYQIVARLGVGGMATVFKAYQPKMDRYVALKVLQRHFSNNPQFVSRFSQEARLIAKLEHPHILPVHDFGESDGYTYLAMRLVEGGSLSDLLKKQGKLELTKINCIVTQVGGALDYAHEKGVIHRDCKPGNVLIDEFESCLLTDFGIAKLVEASSYLTHTGGILGTPFYISPEQGSGKPIDNRSDIYSLGVMLYQMVIGNVPYKADTPMAVIFKHIHDPLPLPRQQVPDLPEPVERVILKALAKNPGDRYSTANELVDSLQSAIDQLTSQTQKVQKPISEPGSTQIARKIPSDPEKLPFEPSDKPRPDKIERKKTEGKKTLQKKKEKFRTGRRWVYGVLVIFLLAVLAGSGWLFYNNMFSSEPFLGANKNPALDPKVPLKGHLYVDSQPDNAKIRILNIGPAFYQGMPLDAGRYHVEVSAGEYETIKLWVTLVSGEDKSINVRLKKRTVAPSSSYSSYSSAREIKRDGRFVAYADGTVKDTKTGLMWASKDNGEDINWNDAKRYCENYRGGGYTDWRMPTQDELAGLYEPNTKNTNPSTGGCSGGYHINKLFHITCCCPWASETRGSFAALFRFDHGYRHWLLQSFSPSFRALPVRSGK